MSKVKSNHEYLARLVEVSSLINPQHGNRGFAAVQYTKAKSNSVYQLDDVSGSNIERIRIKLLDGKSLSKTEIKVVRNAIEAWYESRERNNKGARIVFNVLAGVFTLGFFHLGYFVAKLFNRSLATDPSKEIFTVFHSYKVMKTVENFLNDTKDFNGEKEVKGSFAETSELLGSREDDNILVNFPVNTQGLDAILAGEDNSSSEDQTNASAEDHDQPADDESESFSFNPYL